MLGVFEVQISLCALSDFLMELKVMNLEDAENRHSNCNTVARFRLTSGAIVKHY